MLFRSHIVSDVESIANEIIMIKDQQVLYQDSVSDICKKLDGLIYETEVEYEAAAAFRKKYFSLSEKQESGRMYIRFLTDEQTKPEWRAARPNLEDVFLHTYQDEALQQV